MPEWQSALEEYNRIAEEETPKIETESENIIRKRYVVRDINGSECNRVNLKPEDARKTGIIGEKRFYIEDFNRWPVYSYQAKSDAITRYNDGSSDGAYTTHFRDNRWKYVIPEWVDVEPGDIIDVIIFLNKTRFAITPPKGNSAIDWE